MKKTLIFLMTICMMLWNHYMIALFLPENCSFLDTMTNNTSLRNGCLSSKYTYFGKNRQVLLSNYSGYYRAVFDSNEGDLFILVLNEKGNKQYQYIDKKPFNVPKSAFSLNPFWSLTKTLNLTKNSMANGTLRVSTNGVEIMRNGISIWKGNSGKCNSPQLIMQYDRNLVLYCEKDKYGNPKTPKWKTNTNCQGQTLNVWCSNSG